MVRTSTRLSATQKDSSPPLIYWRWSSGLGICHRKNFRRANIMSAGHFGDRWQFSVDQIVTTPVLVKSYMIDLSSFILFCSNFQGCRWQLLLAVRVLVATEHVTSIKLVLHVIITVEQTSNIPIRCRFTRLHVLHKPDQQGSRGYNSHNTVGFRFQANPSQYYLLVPGVR